jgi:hypothetical protein
MTEPRRNQKGDGGANAPVCQGGRVVIALTIQNREKLLRSRAMPLTEGPPKDPTVVRVKSATAVGAKSSQTLRGELVFDRYQDLNGAAR